MVGARPTFVGLAILKWQAAILITMSAEPSCVVAVRGWAAGRTTSTDQHRQEDRHMDPKKTALVMIGYQNDYFAKDGVLRGVVEEPGRVDEVLGNSVGFVRQLLEKGATVIATPIVLHADYRAMASPGGILHTMKEVGAFAAGTKGAENIAELEQFGDKIEYVGGKVGFNAFANTELDALLRSRSITNVLICGMVTSLCVDSSGRAAYERGYDVTIVSDCTSGRSATEHEFYCQSVFPLYGAARGSDDLLTTMT